MLKSKATVALIFVGLISACAAPAPAPAPAPVLAPITGSVGIGSERASSQTVERLLAITQAENTARALENQLQGSLAWELQQRNLSAADERVTNKYVEEWNALILPEVSWTRLKPEIVNAYSSTFTEEEANDLIAFYTSKTGRSYLRKAPQLSQLTMGSTQSRMRALEPKLQDILRRLDAELQAKHKAASAPASKK